MYEIKLIENFDSIRNIKREWLDFENQLTHQDLNVSYDWVENWWQIFKTRNDNIFGRNKEIKILLFFLNKKLHTIVPLVKLYRQYYGFKISFIEFIGQQWGGQSLDLIGNYIGGEELQIILSWVKKNVRYDFMMLKHLPETTPLKHCFKMHAYSGSPIISLSKYNGYEDYKSKNYSKKLKQNIRTAHNKARKKGILINESIEKMNSNNYDEILRLSKQKLKDGKSFLYADDAKSDFYKTTYSKFNSNIAFIKLDGKNVSFRSNIIVNKIKYCIDASYDRNYKQYDLGALAVDLNIRDSFIQNLEIHSMGPGLDMYKLRFTKDIKKFYMIGSRGNTKRSMFLSIFFKYFLKRRENEFRKSLNSVQI